ncbi:ATP-binding protein [Rhizobium sp. LjRoot30]
MVDGATALLDRAAASWLARTGDGHDVPAHEIAILRRLALTSSAALFAVPVALSAVASPAVALPVGVTLVAAGFLFSSVGSIALSRLRQTARPEIAAPAPDGALLDACAGLILFIDPYGGVTGLAGRDRKTFLSWMRDPAGRGFFDQLHVSDRLHFMQALDCLRQGEEAISVDLRIDRPTVVPASDQFIHVRLDLTAVRSADGTLSSVFCQMQDISLQQSLKAEAVRKAAEAESANDAKTRFLAAVSHELRTPLNAILGFSDILTGEYFGKLENDRQREYVRLIRQSGAHLLSVVNTMLDMSKIEAGRYELMMEPFVIGESIRTCEEMLALQAREKGLTLTSRVQRGIGEVIADQRAIQQILINLVGNAIKFTDEGGVVTVDAASNGFELVLTVSDTGIGIAENKLATLGQPFVQVQNDYTRRYEGTGLGLSLVKGLVALHGGRFAISSRPGEGTVITITVPMDGSGASSADDAADWARTVEFPPRLKGAPEPVEAQHEDDVHEQATAKIA